ncbi:MAG: PfkB family carbohydrate kinase [Planctomycetota bacterium]
MVDIICLGELLIDFISNQKDISLGGSPGFGKAPGGAPANVAVGLAKLGAKAGFIGKVGDDPFGRYLEKTLKHHKVNTAGLAFDKKTRTTLAFVTRFSNGRNEFTFYRHPGADMMLKPAEIKESYFKRAGIFHFGSISLISQPIRSAVFKALGLAKKHRLIISYDPNLRLSLWDSPAAARKGIWQGFKYADIAKLSEQEWRFITGTSGFRQGSRKLLDIGVKLVIISLGARGCYYNNGRSSGYVAGYKVKAVDTTGAGDGFMAAVLAGIAKQSYKKDKSKLNELNLKEILGFANAAGALTTTRVGAINGLPTRQEAIRFLRAGNRAYDGKLNH